MTARNAVKVRAHVVLPKELLDEIDTYAGKRERSRFIEEAVKAKLVNERQRSGFERYAGVLKSADHPEWETPEKTSEWVRRMREEAEEGLADKMRGVQGWSNSLSQDETVSTGDLPEEAEVE